MYTQQVKNAIDYLLEKYNAKPVKEKHFVQACFFKGESDEYVIPLQSWRYNRKFVELQKLIENGTVEYPVMFRFSSLGDQSKWTIFSLIYRELDLCEFLGNCSIISLHAVLNETAGSVIIKLSNGIICSVEVGTSLKIGAKMIDRHEIIARRGVASDIVVDTQKPQSSIYVFTQREEISYKDVDNELYGLDETDVAFVRSVFEVSKQPDLIPFFIQRHQHLTKWVEAAVESDKARKKISI